VLSDAGVTSLVIDPNPMFVERARRRLDKVDALKQILTFGQLTVQELGTFYARGIRPVVFVLNNDGYTVERLLQSPNADYQDIVQWNWTELPAALGGTDVRTAKIRTVGELRAALQGASDPEHAWFIEVVLPRMDLPHMLTELARGKRATKSTPSED
jgi:indolepyruvate decarboxylase